jgi:hypothetical protein
VLFFPDTWPKRSPKIVISKEQSWNVINIFYSINYIFFIRDRKSCFYKISLIQQSYV